MDRDTETKERLYRLGSWWWLGSVGGAFAVVASLMERATRLDIGEPPSAAPIWIGLLVAVSCTALGYVRGWH